MIDTSHSRRLPRYSLRSMFGLLTIAALVLALGIEHRQRVQTEATIDKIEAKLDAYFAKYSGQTSLKDAEKLIGKIESVVSSYREPNKVEEEYNLLGPDSE